VDFAPDETHQTVIRLAAEVMGRHRPAAPAEPHGPAHRDPELGKPAQRDPGQWDSALWQELGRAGLLSLALPAWLGGDGLGVMDTAALLTEVGRRAAAVPALATLMLGVLPVIRWGDRGLQQALLAGVAASDTLITAAVREPSEVMPQAPATTAALAGEPRAASAGPEPAGTGSISTCSLGTVSGVKVGVPYAAAADWILVPASIASGGTGVVIVARSADGVSLWPTPTAAGEPEYTLRLDEAPVSHVLGAGPDSAAVTGLYQLALAGACCLADGALAGALALTTAHVASREQFGRPLATFQAVAQQIAEVYIQSRTLHLATLAACWQLDTGREAAEDLDVAAYWLAEHTPAALRACHHLHGGIGMDVSYPLHRYSSLVKDLARFVGGADYRLDRLGAGTCAGAGDSAGK
jgi:alkylation response protein AidB-like acyl-CoA dehydrogenase